MAKAVLEAESLEINNPDGENMLDPDAEKELKPGSLFDRIHFSWAPEDRSILDRIHAAADEAFVELFSDSMAAVDQLYAALRQPRVGTNGLALVSEGRVVWERDEYGHVVERIENLTGQDLATAILRLQRAKMSASLSVNRLRSEAMYAKRVADDAFDDHWPASGTQGDRTTQANKHSRSDRYHAFFRYHLYSQANTFLREIDELIRRLDGIRYTLTREQV